MNLSGIKILVVDDIGAMVQITCSQLRALGALEIQTASNGADALRLLQVQPFDLILSDWNMPVMSGLELLRYVRAEEKLAGIPLLMVTAEADRDRITEAISCGVSDLLVKPYTRQRLEDKIAAVLTRRGVGAAPLPMPAPRAPAPQAALPQPTLLVVDDMPDNLRLIADLFNDRCKVKVAHNGAKALAICMSDHPPDLVLLDVMMPDMDGFEVARRLREHPTSAQIPIIFLTALTDVEARKRGLGLGAVDFVSKPVDPELLQLRVNNFMRHIAVHLQQQAEYDALLETARLREQVERMLRHDISGPLAGVVALASELAATLAGADPALAPAHADQARLIERSAQQALATVRLSSELLAIETGSFRLNAQSIDVGPLLREAAELARAASGGRVTIDVVTGPGTPRVAGDLTLCQAVFHNLLKNACEAAPAGAQVKVTLVDDEPMRIVIENPGAVPAEIRARFFERGVSQGKQDGSGIGTYSAKLLVEAQHGGIAMTADDANNRTLLTVTLPRARG